jgi:hypothetical protein
VPSTNRKLTIQRENAEMDVAVRKTATKGPSFVVSTTATNLMTAIDHFRPPLLMKLRWLMVVIARNDPNRHQKRTTLHCSVTL